MIMFHNISHDFLSHKMPLKYSLFAYVKQALEITTKRSVMLQKTFKWFMFADKERQFNRMKTLSCMYFKL